MTLHYVQLIYTYVCRRKKHFCFTLFSFHQRKWEHRPAAFRHIYTHSQGQCTGRLENKLATLTNMPLLCQCCSNKANERRQLNGSISQQTRNNQTSILCQPHHTDITPTAVQWWQLTSATGCQQHTTVTLNITPTWLVRYTGNSIHIRWVLLTLSNATNNCWQHLAKL